MGKRSTNRKLETIAKELPSLSVLTQEFHFVIGSVLIAQGDTHLPDGTKRNPLKLYEQAMPVMIEINHTNQLKKHYKEHGYPGIIAYIAAVEKRKQEEDQA